MTRILVLLLLCVAGAGSPASAQPLSADQKAALLAEQWRPIFDDVMRVRGLTIRDNRLAPTDPAQTRVDEDIRDAYTEMLDRLVGLQAMDPFFEPDPDLTRQITPEAERRWIAMLPNSGLDAKGAKSLNANATNPAGNHGSERSGFSDLIGLATDLKDVASADDSAISLNLNALALFSLRSTNVYSAQEQYRQHDAIRRVAGTVTFGAKIPESEITGFKGVPGFDTLLDVFVWDVKYRVYGDRDPRAGRWYREMLGTVGGLGEIVANLGASVPIGDLQLFRQAAAAALGGSLAHVKRQVENSTQIALKGAGQHLTKQSGRNKYTFGVLADKGFGDLDLTLNLLYSTTDQIEDVVGAEPFQARDIIGTIGFVSPMAINAIVPGRAMMLGVDFNFDVPVQKDGAREDLKTIWRVVSTVSVPFGKAAMIPISITYANDPNNVGKQNYVIGHIGIAYDFGSLKTLFQ